MDSYNLTSIEHYWQELKTNELPYVLPFNNIVFEEVIRTMKDFSEYSQLDFSIDCMDKDAESNSFLKMVTQSFPKYDDANEFVDAYTTFDISLITTQLHSFHGEAAAE